MLKLAVIGKDVSKSKSPALHEFLLGGMGETCTYDRISIPPGQFDLRIGELLNSYDAFNVTIPFKQTVIKHLHEMGEEAKALGAVNTVLCRERKGFNTDAGGFSLMLESVGADLAGKTVLILGAGGAGRSCIYQLKELGARVSVYEKNTERLNSVFSDLGGFEPLEKISLASYDCIVNCTGVGMHNTEGELPKVRAAAGEIPLPDELFRNCTLAVDLIYEPAQSAFLKRAQELKIKAINGMPMLFFQAYLSDCIYLNRTPDLKEARIFYEQYQKENL